MILADEPTGALDSANAAHVLEIFQGLESPERAVVMVTHDPTVAATAHRKVSMRDGQIVADERRPSVIGGVVVSTFRDLLGVAWTGLTARKVRTLLIMLGPIVGVAAMVGAVGLTESAKGDLKQKLVEARHEPDHRPGRRHVRLAEPDVPRRRGAPGRGRVDGHERGRDHQPLERDRGPDRRAAATTTRRSRCRCAPPTSTCRRCSRCRWSTGAGSTSADTQAAHARRRCSAPGSRSNTRTCAARHRTIRLNDTTSAWSACSAPVALDPDLDNAVFITQWAAKHDFATDGKPNQLYVRSKTGDDAGDRRRDPDRDQPRWPRPGVDEGPERRAAGRVAGRQDAAADRAVRGPARARGRRPRHRERHVDLGDPAIVGDRHPPRGGPQPLEDRRRSSCSSRCSSASSAGSSAPRSGSASCTSCPRSRTGSS